MATNRCFWQLFSKRTLAKIPPSKLRPGSSPELRACKNAAMDIAFAVMVAMVAAAAGVIGFIWGRSGGGEGERRLAELEAQLAASRENAVRLGTQAAELEREAERLR